MYYLSAFYLHETNIYPYIRWVLLNQLLINFPPLQYLLIHPFISCGNNLVCVPTCCSNYKFHSNLLVHSSIYYIICLLMYKLVSEITSTIKTNLVFCIVIDLVIFSIASEILFLMPIFSAFIETPSELDFY